MSDYKTDYCTGMDKEGDRSVGRRHRRRAFRVGDIVRDRRGVAYIEFALVLPLLLLLIAGGIELTRYILANQKMDKAAYSLADFISQQPDPENMDYSVLDASFASLISPFGTDNASFAVSGILPSEDDLAVGEAGTINIAWTKGSGAGSSRLGAFEGSSDIDGLNIYSNEFFIAVEVFYNYKNIIPAADYFFLAYGESGSPPNVSGRQVYKRAILRYRFDAERDKTVGIPQSVPSEPDCCGEYCVPRVPKCTCVVAKTCDTSLVSQYPATCIYRGDAVCNNQGGGSDDDDECEDVPWGTKCGCGGPCTGG